MSSIAELVEYEVMSWPNVEKSSSSLHHILPQTGWVSYYIQGAESVPGLIELFRLNCQIAPPARSRRLVTSGLHRNESRTFAGALLWLRSPMHQGALTRCPS